MRWCQEVPRGAKRCQEVPRGAKTYTERFDDGLETFMSEIASFLE